MHDWSDASLNRLRAKGDPLADAFVADEIAAGRAGALYAWIADKAPAGPALRAWLDQPAAPFADPARVRRGQQVYGRHALQAILALTCKGLPKAYSAAPGAEILLTAGRFASEPRQRLLETCRFFLAVMEPGALDQPGTAGWLEIQKVRLVHAMSRRHIAAHPRYQAAWGHPVNQEDLIGTLLCFSTQVLDGYQSLGSPCRADEEADYHHAWREIGYALGVDPDFIPDSPADGRAALRRIFSRHQRPSAAGTLLTGALLEALASLIPGERMDALPRSLIVELCGARVAGILGVSPPRGHSLTVRMLKALSTVGDQAFDRSSLGAKAVEALGRALFDGIIEYSTGGQRPIYQPPPGWQRGAAS
jgi:hypothetical protein